jgi:hypothetical protein
MKPLSKSSEQGSILLLSLFTALAIGSVLSSFLVLITQKNNLSWRSQDWNAAIPVAEAGVEEALTHLNLDTNSPSANGWTASTIAGQPVNIKRRSFADGSYFNTTIYNAGTTNPIIYSAGFIPAPLNTNTYITRLVRVNLNYLPGIFTEAIESSGPITVNGIKPTVDSYLSPPYSFGNHRTNAPVVTGGQNVTIDVGNGSIYGPVTTSPTGNIQVGPNGKIFGTTNNNFNTPLIQNAVPSGPFVTPSGSPLTLGTGSYQLSSLSGSGQSAALTVSGNVTLYVTGDVSLAGQSTITINSGGSLTLVVGGSAKLAGGGVVNTTGDPANFSLVGLPTCTSVSVSGNSAFYGSVNAPNADVSLVGTSDFFGAVIGASVTISGGGSFHYDESLARAPSLKVSGWSEM